MIINTISGMRSRNCEKEGASERDLTTSSKLISRAFTFEINGSRN